MQKSYKIWIIPLLVLTLSLIFAPKIMSGYTQKARLTKLFNSSQEGRDFLAKNPDFITSIIDYPLIVGIIKNAVNVGPEAFVFFKNHKEFFDELKLNPRMQKIVNSYSIYPLAIKVVFNNYESFHSFVLKHPIIAEMVMGNKEYSEYLCVDHIDKFEESLKASDPVATGKRLYEEFVVERYLKFPSK